MNTKHTPGPWTIRVDAPHDLRIRCEPQLVTVAVVADQPNPGEEALEALNADARLIAAAPELLEALDRIGGQAYDVAEYGENELRERLAEVRRLARAAIAKATGSDK